eukprot:SAG11_NODE_11300_length_770_cov_0.956781_1_plen_209_part_10
MDVLASPSFDEQPARRLSYGDVVEAGAITTIDGAPWLQLAGHPETFVVAERPFERGAEPNPKYLQRIDDNAKPNRGKISGTPLLLSSNVLPLLEGIGNTTANAVEMTDDSLSEAVVSMTHNIAKTGGQVGSATADRDRQIPAIDNPMDNLTLPAADAPNMSAIDINISTPTSMLPNVSMPAFNLSGISVPVVDMPNISVPLVGPNTSMP